MIFLLLIPHLLLLSGPDWISAAISAVIYLGCGSLVFFHDREKRPLSTLYFPVLSGALSLLSGVLFYLRWHHAEFFLSLESLPEMPAKRICGITAALLTVLALWGTDIVLQTFYRLILKKEPVKRPLHPFVYLGLTSVSVMTLVSKCSPFYAFNDWVDPHTMFTVGKSILHGMVPYKEVFEQKGPVILFLHTIGAMISFDSFLGIWILEIISCFFFLLFSWRILRLYLQDKALPLMPVLALIAFTGLSFEQGDSAEEFCLPLLAYALLVGCRSLKKNALPTRKEWILIGITSGCVLWTKFSMLGFYLGWFSAVCVFAANQKRGCDAWRGVLWIALGVGIVSAPILLWFALNGAFVSLFEVYFYENMFLYPKTADMYGHFALHRNLANGLLNFAFFSTVIFITSILGLVWLRYNEEKSVFRLALYSFIALFLVLFFSGRFYTYYSLIFGIYVPFGLCMLFRLMGKIPIKRLRDMNPAAWGAVSLCLCVLGVFLFSGNMRSLAFETDDYPQFQAKKLIETSGIEQPTLLNYEFLDMGVNQIARLLPNQRFFCGFNLPLNTITKEQDACLASGCTDFVMTFFLEIDSPNYRLLERFPANFSVGPIHPTYNLYQKIQ